MLGAGAATAAMMHSMHEGGATRNSLWPWQEVGGAEFEGQLCGSPARIAMRKRRRKSLHVQRTNGTAA